MKKVSFSLMAVVALILTGCGGGQSEQDKQIRENEKKIELLKQEAEIKRLENEVQNVSVQAASDVGQVYQLAASEVANTIPSQAQSNAKAGEVVQGTDGQQYMFDADSGNWLLYGALGAAAGYLAANAMNKNKYTPVQKPTAAVERVYKDYQVKHPNQIPAPKAQNGKTFVPAAAPQNAQPKYRQSNQGYSNHQAPARKRLGGVRRRR